MIEAQYIQRLKRGNTSIDADKTKERVAEIWKPASRQEKQDALNLAGQVRATVYKTIHNGMINAKLVLAIAQTMNADPFYLTGESDECREYSQEIAQQWLKAHNCPAITQFRKRTAKAPKEPLPESKITAVSNGDNTSPVRVSSQQDFPIDMTEEDMLVLFRALLIRAKVDENCAKQIAELKRILLS